MNKARVAEAARGTFQKTISLTSVRGWTSRYCASLRQLAEERAMVLSGTLNGLTLRKDLVEVADALIERRQTCERNKIENGM